MSANHNALLEQAMEAARDGDRITARKLIEQVMAADSKNIKAWMLLYRISEDLEEKRQALKKVLEIAPDNIRAQEALDKLNARMGLGADAQEVAPGVNRRALLYGVVGLLLFAVIAIAVLAFVLLGNQNAETTARATQTAFIAQQTGTELANLTATVAVQQAAAFATLTQEAIVSPTPSTTPTVLGPPTLPPTFTPTPTRTPVVSPTPLSQPEGLSGTILGWGGVDISSDGYLRVISMPLNGGGAFNELSGLQRGRYVTGLSLEEIVYARWQPDFFTLELQDLNGISGATDIFATRYIGIEQVFFRTTQPAYFTDGKLVFVALATDTNSFDVFLYRPSPPGMNPITRLTNDPSNYSFPTFTADGEQVIAVKADENNFGHDLVLIDISTALQRNLTTDGDAIIESAPRVSPDNQVLAYIAKAGEDSDGNLVIFPLVGATGPLQLTTDAADDQFPVFSPDGRYLAFASNRYSPNHQIYLYDINTGQQYQLSRDAQASFFPGVWLPQ
jgi:Tol biopolymer transport system component